MTQFQGRLGKQAWMEAPETVKVMEALGLEARFVGGCVRDALANRKVVDIDIATPLKPEEVIERLKAHKLRYAATGLKHGTVTALVDGKPFEVTTLRRDVTTYGRHADVAFTDDWHADAARRDFTFNAMSATMEGQVFDPFGGIADLRMGRVVFVGDAAQRIREDHLRILRFFRFHAHFGQGAPDAAALKACAENAELLTRLSAERIRQETLKLLDARDPAPVWKIMLENRVVTEFLPEATNVKTLAALTALEEKYHDGAGVLRRLAALLDVTHEGIAGVRAALRLSNAQGEQLEKLAFPVPGVTPQMDHKAARALVYRVGNDVARSLILLAAARAGEGGDFAALHHAVTAFRAPRFPLEGDDVLKLGVKPGPRVGKLLSDIEAWWLSEDFAPGRGACLDRLKSLAAP
jgi:poly(A) polymerase